MTPITIESTTDTKEAVTAALGSLAPKASEVEKEPETHESKEEPAEQAEESAEVEGEATEANEDEESGESQEENESEELEAEAENDDGEEKPKKKGGWQRRIDKQTRRIRELETELKSWQQRVLRTDDSSQERSAQEAKEPAKESQKPRPQDFESHEAYLDARDEWVAKKAKLEAIQEVEKSQKENQVKTEFQRKLQAHAQRVTDFSKSHPDFDEVVAPVGDLPMSITVQQSILESDVGAELVYELAKDPEEYARINKLSPILAAKEIGKIEAFILAKATDSSQNKTTKTPKAPPPLNPLKARGTKAIKGIDDPDISQAEFEKLRAKQIKARREAGY